MALIVDVVRISSFLEIDRKTCLPIPGEVLVEIGSEIIPGDNIAEAQVPGNVTTLDIAKGLGLSPAETNDCLMREIGENLEEGDVIAQSGKIFPRLFRAPVNGKIIDLRHGQLLLATGSTRIDLKARMIGRVKEIIPAYGVVLSVKGSLIQGIWGNGFAGCGALHVVDSTSGMPVASSDLDSVEDGGVLAGGIIIDNTVIEQCREKKLAGLILGALPPRLVQKALDLPFPVILLHKFGDTLQAMDSFELLTSRQGDLVNINACVVNYYSGERPEVIIPKDEGEPERQLGFRKKLEVGDQVRLISGKPMYQVGKVVDLIDKEQLFENGVFLPVAVVKLKSMEKIRVPQQNLFVIG